MIAVWLVAALALPSGGVDQSPAPSQVRANFRNPPKRYRPMVRWFWPGGDVRDEELRREIGVLDSAHFGGAEIQPFRLGLDPRAPADVLRRVNDYRTPSFFGHMGAALGEATRRGMWIDYTMGSGWPFGGGLGITPELVQLELGIAHRTIDGGRRFKEPIPWPSPPPGFGTFVARITGVADSLPPGWPDRLTARERLVAVVAVRGTAAVVETGSARDLIGNPVREVKRRGLLDPGTAVVLTERVAEDRVLDWTVPEGEWQLFTVVQRAADQRVLGGVGGPQLVVDHLDRRAIEAHFAGVGDSAIRYLRRFAGRAWRGIFIDSLELDAELLWTEAFLAHFRRLRGYDLTPLLPLLDQGYDATGIGDRVRHDYHETVADLLAEQAFGPFAQWAARHRMVSRIQAHDAPADQQRLYSLGTIPETENLHGGGRYDLLKLASSSAHLYRRPITSAESFVWIMEEYQTTPEKMKRLADEMLAAGVNQIVASGFPVVYQDRGEPGWYPFVSPFPYASHLSEGDPLWRFLRPLNDYITRVQYLSQVGAAVTPVAVLQTELGFSERPADHPVVRFVRDLVGAGYDFDYVNGPALLGSRVVGGRLVSPGGARYETLVLVGVERLAVEVMERIAAFGQAGLSIVVVGGPPSEVPGYRDHRARGERVRALAAALRRLPNVKFASAAEAGLERVRASVAPNVRLSGGGAGISTLEKRIGALNVYFLRNGSAEGRSVVARFPRARGRAERWDPWTGGTVPFDPVASGEDGLAFAIELDPYGSALVVFDGTGRSSPARAVPAAVARRTVPIGDGTGWRFEAVGRIGSGEETRIERPAAPLFDWATDSLLASFSGRGTYRAELSLESSDLDGTRIELDLGQVRDVAEIVVNGVPGPTLLLRPYRADLTGYLRAGSNEIAITVTNPPLNRMIGAGRTLGILFVESLSRPPKRLPAGLLGPVRLTIRSR